jgi:hypothetical protein
MTTTRKTFIAALAACIAAAALGCSDDVAQEEYLESEHSDCLDGSGLKSVNDAAVDEQYPSWIEWSYDAATQELAVTHHNAMFNCCPSGIRSWSEIEGSEISLWEEDYSTSGDWCACECPYDITSYIPGVAPGAYTLSIYRGDNTIPTEVVEIDAQ